jgi:hypothetical protein
MAHDATSLNLSELIVQMYCLCALTLQGLHAEGFFGFFSTSRIWMMIVAEELTRSLPIPGLIRNLRQPD